MKLAHFSALVAAVALVSCTDTPSSPTADVPGAATAVLAVEQVHQDVGPILTTNQCNGEQVKFYGTVHVVIKDLGNSTFELRTNFADLKGEGLVTGDTYRLQQNSHRIVYDPFPSNDPPASQTSEVHSRVISTGGGDNFHLIIEQTVTFPPLDVTTTVVRFECHG